MVVGCACLWAVVAGAEAVIVSWAWQLELLGKFVIHVSKAFSLRAKRPSTQCLERLTSKFFREGRTSR